MNKVKFIIMPFVFLLLLALLYLMLHDRCKTLNFFKTTIDFGTAHLKTCFSIHNVKDNVKKRLINIPRLYKPTVKLYQKYYLKIEENLETNEILKQDDQNTLKVPFILGLVNKDNIIKNKKAYSDDDYEYNRWYRSHGGNWNTKYNSKNYINKKNINKLKLAWAYSSIDSKDLEKKWKSNIELNPVFINNKIILVTADWKIVALNAKNGDLIWELQSDFMPSRRGILAENDLKNNSENIFIPIGGVVYKINAKNGKLKKKFGNNGFIKAFTLVAPIIYKEKIIIIGRHELLIFNKDTGKFISKINIHPKDINHYGGIVWGGAALDKNKGIVYVSTGNPRPQLFGFSRPGDNKRSNSIVALDLNKEKVIWDFQETSHDLWDFDIPSPPIIHNLVIDEYVYEVVIAVTKVGNTIILERNTGEPIFDITYKKAPLAKNIGEITSAYQINLDKPEKFSKIEYSAKDISKLPKEKKSEIKKIMEESNYGWFEPPSIEKNLITFGLHGGASWPGAAIDPVNQDLFIPVNNIPWILRNYIHSTELNTSFPNEIKDQHKIYIKKCSSCHGEKRNGSLSIKGEKLIKHVPSLVGFYATSNKIGNFDSWEKIKNKHSKIDLNSEEFNKLQNLFKWWDNKIFENNETEITSTWYQFLTKDGLPASNPPWGYIAKLDLVSGKIIFKSPVGYMNINNNQEKIGTPNYGGVALNGAEILFFSGTEDSKAYAIDASNGFELWSYKMEAAGSAPPIIFNLDGKQYVSFISTGGTFHNFKKKGSTIYTFTISD